MLIIPAIDLRGGQCVRLRQGDYAQETIFGNDPAALAEAWVQQGAQYLHVVDLDGARAGRPVNAEAIRAIVKRAGVPCQLGGGLRSDADIDQALGWGVDRVVIGTRALDDPNWFEALCQRLPEKVVLGIDAKEGKVASQGWVKLSDYPAVVLARQYASLPLAALVYTDISRDGMLQGPNLAAIGQMAATVSLPVIASGGVTTLDDLRRLADLKVSGCIVGRALYEGTIDLATAIRTVGRQ